MTEGSAPQRRPTDRLRRLLGRPHADGRQRWRVLEGADEGPRAWRRCPQEPDGRRVLTVSGRLRAVHTRTLGSSPALTAELDDGSTSLCVVWLGRTTVAGIVPGRRLTVTGRPAPVGGRAVLYNPRYELLTTIPNGAGG